MEKKLLSNQNAVKKIAKLCQVQHHLNQIKIKKDIYCFYQIPLYKENTSTVFWFNKCHEVSKFVPTSTNTVIFAVWIGYILLQKEMGGIVATVLCSAVAMDMLMQDFHKIDWYLEGAREDRQATWTIFTSSKDFHTAKSPGCRCPCLLCACWCWDAISKALSGQAF